MKKIYRLEVFQVRVVTLIYGRVGAEITEGWIKPYTKAKASPLHATKALGGKAV
jgi:hypothetical protein